MRSGSGMGLIGELLELPWWVVALAGEHMNQGLMLVRLGKNAALVGRYVLWLYMANQVAHWYVQESDGTWAMPGKARLSHLLVCLKTRDGGRHGRDLLQLLSVRLGIGERLGQDRL